MKIRKIAQSLWFLAVLVWAPWGVACMGEPSLAQLRNGVRIVAKAQYGLRLQGQQAVPQVTRIDPLGRTKAELKIVGQPSVVKDSRSFWERLFGDPPKFEKILIPNTLDMKPDLIEENESRYKVTIRDGAVVYLVELLFEAGAQRTFKGGCGGGNARIEDL